METQNDTKSSRIFVSVSGLKMSYREPQISEQRAGYCECYPYLRSGSKLPEKGGREEIILKKRNAVNMRP
jgi:hypothetical protein